jgi:hypothetical protein
MSARERLDKLARGSRTLTKRSVAHRDSDAPSREAALRAFAGEHYSIMASDRPCFAHRGSVPRAERVLARSRVYTRAADEEISLGTPADALSSQHRY